jgi:hypothetical protein
MQVFLDVKRRSCCRWKMPYSVESFVDGISASISCEACLHSKKCQVGAHRGNIQRKSRLVVFAVEIY